ncbi:MAG: hypothetical protein M3Z54_08320 [Gemmatimonadota bacterium]|nr:hypothetical protein [Gemmatimonadota bacterium]
MDEKTLGAKNLQRFDALRLDADEVLRLQRRAEALFAKRQPLAFDGLGDLLDQVLPRDSESEQRISRVLRFRENELVGLRRSDLDPAGLSHEGLAMLGQAIALNLASFMALVERDHNRFKEAGEYAAPRELANDDAELKSLREAWDRLELDNPEQ